MTYFADLSAYEYWPGLPNGLNIGWLSPDHSFPRGAVSLAFAHEMMLLGEGKVENVTRGVHVCEFCQAPVDLIQADPHYQDVWELFRSGNGELHVKGNAGVVYCAPALIVHYVSEHQYQPPQEFVEAVLRHRQQRQRRPPKA
jgi:hypothetical protein